MAWKNRSIPLVAGMDASIGDGQRPDPVLHRLINARVTKTGEIAKRHGFTGLSRVIYDELTAARTLINVDGSDNRFAARNLLVNTNRKNSETSDSMLLLSEGPLFKYAGSTNGWRPKDIYTTAVTEGIYRPTGVGCGIESQRVLRDIGDQHDTVSACNDSYVLTAWIEVANNAQTDPRLYYSIYDIKNGDYIVGEKLVANSDVLYSMAIGTGSSLGLIYASGANLVWLNLSSPLAPASTTLATDVVNIAAASGTALPFYLAPSHSGTYQNIVVYKDTGGGVGFIIFSYAGVIDTLQSLAAPASPIHALAIEYDNVNARYVLAIGKNSLDIQTKVYTTALADSAIDVVFTATDAIARLTIGFDYNYNGATAGTKYNTIIIAEERGATYRRVNIMRRMSTAATGDAGTYIYRHATLLSTCFRQDNLTYVALGYGPRDTNNVTAQGTVFVVCVGQHMVEGQPMCIAGKWGHGSAAGDMDSRAADIKGPPSRATYTSTTKKWYIGHRSKTRFVTSGGLGFNPDFSKSVFLAFDFNVGTSYVNVNDLTYFTSGSLLKQFDGEKVAEAGFLVYPEIVAANYSVGGAGGVLATGSYSYRFYYESMIGGKRVRSFAASATGISVTLGQKVTFTIPTLSFTQRPETGVYIVGYRTTVNPTAGTPYYRITELSPRNAVVNGWYYNSFTADTVSIIDAIADASMILETDYIYQGEVDHIIPEIKYITKHGNRLIGADSYNIHPSLLFDVFNAVEFSDTLSQQIVDIGGPITGISSLGNNLAVFKKNRTFVMTGEGPDNTGVGNYSEMFETVQRVGATNQQCIDRIPGGVVFASENGLYVLSESFQPQYIGKPIHELVKTLGHSYLKIVYNPFDKAVYILVGSTDYLDTNIFVFYTDEQVWTVWDLDTTFDVCDIAVCDNVIVALTRWCTVSKQGTSTWSDTFIDDEFETVTSYAFTMVLDFINIVPQDPATYSRCRSVKFVSTRTETQASQQVSVSTKLDSSDTNENWDLLDPGVLDGENTYNTTGASNRFEHYLTLQRCSNIRIRLSYNWSYEGYRFTHVILRTKPSENSSKDSPDETT